jgi:CRP-like cAMP-binding protein
VSTDRFSPTSNELLASLSPEVLDVLHSRAECVELPAEETLTEAGSVLRHVYFPITAVVSLFLPLQSGAGAEVAMVGREGAVGVSAFMGGGKALASAVVQRAGSAWRMRASDVADLAQELEPFMKQLLRYTQALFTHMAQTSACHRHHALHAQLCRWLLLHLDRQTGEDIHITQERIAAMLGVRREGVTAAALKLQSRGLIRYQRGHIQVLHRQGLEQQCCECYGVMRQAYDQLRSSSPAWPQSSPSWVAESTRVAFRQDGKEIAATRRLWIEPEVQAIHRSAAAR